MTQSRLKHLFEDKIKIESKVRSILSLFGNPATLQKTDYKPHYQRNYVWDEEKASYFIESIFLGTEIPPLIYFCKNGQNEVIDGRQRYETILRFFENKMRLKKSGLLKLGDNSIGLAGKTFKELEDKNQALFEDTKIRIIEFSFNSDDISRQDEDLVKKEIFQRYNSGITPLRSYEIQKALYMYDDLNTCFKENLRTDANFKKHINHIFCFEKSIEETVLKKIRELCVLPKMPIKYYAIKKQGIIQKFFEYLSENTDTEGIEPIYVDFANNAEETYNLICSLEARGVQNSRLLGECLFWGVSIVRQQTEKFLLTAAQLDYVACFIKNNTDVFIATRSSFYNEIKNRFEKIAELFQELFCIDFSLYLTTNNDFHERKREIVNAPHTEVATFEQMRINKPEPSSCIIEDITLQMKRNRFLLRPVYQRSEVINRKKSSSIIESLLLGIKLPPIFIYKRADGVSEVLDGQQRLLSILGFIGKEYVDYTGNKCKSLKNGYSLDLKDGILTTYNGKHFDDLSDKDKDKINNSDIWIVEINQSFNPEFEPIDFFLRLNNKPYPIKRHSFEMWNSFINRSVIECTKAISNRHKEWFFLRKSNKRMENEEIIVILAFLEYLHANSTDSSGLGLKNMDIYKLGDRINCRIKAKNDITSLLERPENTKKFIDMLNGLEFGFLAKLAKLVNRSVNDNASTMAKNLDEIIGSKKSIRSQQSLYMLWLILLDVPVSYFEAYGEEARQDISRLFQSMSAGFQVEEYKRQIRAFKQSARDKVKDVPYIWPGFKISDVCTLSGNEKGREYDMAVYRKSDLDDRLNMLSPTEDLSSADNMVYIKVRPGIPPLYIKAILSSTYIYSRLDSSGRNITIKSLEGITVPFPPEPIRGSLSNLAGYITLAGNSNSANRFFYRLLDIAVYELYNYTSIEGKESILDMLENLPPYESSDYIEVYNELASPKSPFRAALMNAISQENTEELQ